jgi:hypothetical protein
MVTGDSRTAATTDPRELRRYNYEHFWLKHLLADRLRTARGEGARPGSEAPDFKLETTGGERVRLRTDQNGAFGAQTGARKEHLGNLQHALFFGRRHVSWAR